MLLIKLSVDLSMLVGFIILSFATGFFLRGGQLRKSREKVNDLEKEMMTSHAEILDLQKSKLVLEERLKGSSSIPVIPITIKEEKKADKLQDKTVSNKSMY